MNKLRTVQEIVNLHQGKKGWYRIENAAAPVADVFIYGEIGWEVTAESFLADLQSVTAPQMNVHIATSGGSVFDGIAILNALRAYPGDVTTIVDSQALSAGSFIFQAGKTRKMMPNSTMMIHDALSGGLYVEGNANDIRQAMEEAAKLVDLLDSMSNNIASIYAERAGGTVDEWRAVMQAETWYSAEEAVTVGLADEVIPLDKGSNSTKTQLNTFTDSGRQEANQGVPTSAVTTDPFDFNLEALRQALQEVYQ